MPGPRLRQPSQPLIATCKNLTLLGAAFALLWAVILGPLWRGADRTAETFPTCEAKGKGLSCGSAGIPS